MSTPLKPFAATLKNVTQSKGLVKWSKLWTLLKAVLGNFQISIIGGTVSETEPGSITIDVTGGGDGLAWAWQVIPTGQGISITPGQVFLQNGFGGIEPFVPTLNGTPLDAATAPVLAVPPTGTYYLMLKVEIDKNGNPLNLPWSIVGGFVETESTLLVRPYNDNPGQDAEIYFTLARLDDGQVTLQNWLARPIAIAWTYNNVMAA
jgi:hypothetical protein